MLVRRLGKEKAMDAADDLAGFIQSGVTGTLNKSESLALAVQCFRCLSDYMKTRLEIPVTINTIMTSIGLLTHAVDLAFPGYAEAKFLKFTILPFNSEVKK